LSDLINGIVVAVLGPVFLAATVVLGAIINAPGFDVFMVDWRTLGHTLLNVSIITSYSGLTGYLTKNFFSNQGSFANITPSK